jgi:hypothetical protein
MFAPSSTEVAPAREVTSEIPIVFATHDPVGLGHVASLPRPGGNITGAHGGANRPHRQGAGNPEDRRAARAPSAARQPRPGELPPTGLCQSSVRLTIC